MDSSQTGLTVAHLVFCFWLLSKLLADKLQVFVVQPLLFLAVAVTALPLHGASVAVRLIALVPIFFFFFFVDNEALSDL